MSVIVMIHEAYVWSDEQHGTRKRMQANLEVIMKSLNYIK
jgi:hypothetical protein